MSVLQSLSRGVPVIGHQIGIPELTPAKFDPLGIFVTYPFVIATSPDAPYQTMEELAEYAKSNDVSLGHFGAPLIPTKLTLAAAQKLGFSFASDAAFDNLDCNSLASGDADVINTTLQLLTACVDNVTILASITGSRISLTPDAPTLTEIEPTLTSNLWNGLFVHKDTPQDVRDKIIAVASKTVMTERAQALTSTGAQVYGAYAVTMVPTVVKQAGQPSTVTQYNSFTFNLISAASSTETGGGFQCLAGPVNDRA